MKKVLTILLLLLLTGHASQYIQDTASEVNFSQEACEKGDKGGEEKNEKEFTPQAFCIKIKPSITSISTIYSCVIVLHPSLDYPTPPPDGKC